MSTPDSPQGNNTRPADTQPSGDSQKSGVQLPPVGKSAPDNQPGGDVQPPAGGKSGPENLTGSRGQPPTGGNPVRKAGHQRSSAGEDDNRWPPALQFALAIVVVFVVAGLVLYPPIYTSRLLVEAGIDTAGALDVWAPLLAVFVALTSVTISGTFIFMTFRIDRGTKRTAREVADEKAGRVADEKTKDLHSRICKVLECETTAMRAAECIDRTSKATARLFEETREKLAGSAFRERVFAILFEETDKSLVQSVVKAVLEKDHLLQRRVQRLTTSLVDRLGKDEALDRLARDVLSRDLDDAVVEAVARRVLMDRPTEELEKRVHALMSALDKWWFLQRIAQRMKPDLNNRPRKWWLRPWILWHRHAPDRDDPPRND